MSDTLISPGGGALALTGRTPLMDQQLVIRDILAYRRRILQDSPLHCWPLTEASGTTAADIGSSPANGTYVATVTLGTTPGPTYELAPHWDGSVSAGRVTIAPGAMTPPLTFECWVRLMGTSGDGFLTICYAPATLDGLGLFFGGGNAKKLTFEIANVDHFSTAALSLGIWNHIAITFSVGGSCQFYINGAADATFSGFTSWTPVGIGKGISVNETWNGEIGYVSFYPAVLSQATIQAHYNAGPPLPGTNLSLAMSPATPPMDLGLIIRDPNSYQKQVLLDGATAYWRLNEATGAVTAVDSTANGKNGTYSGGVTLGGASMLPIPTVASSVTFDGVNGKVATTPTTVPIGATFSLEVWAKWTVNNQRPFISNRLSSNVNGEVYFGKSSGRVLCFTQDSGGQTSNAAALSDGNRHHIVWTFDGSNTRIYVDGAIDKTVAATHITLTQPVNLGFDVANNEFLAGTLQECAVYSGVVLTPTQVADHFVKGTLMGGPGTNLGLALTGGTPANVQSQVRSPGGGSLALTGNTAFMDLAIRPGPGSLTLTGVTPGFNAGLSFAYLIIVSAETHTYDIAADGTITVN